MAIQFKSLTNEGQTKTSVEVLKDTSALVDSSAPGKVYQNLNIWVGNVAFDEDDMEDPVVGFRVSKEWISDNGVEASTVVLCRYNDGEWTSLATEVIDEDGDYFTYESETPGFSPFAISAISEEGELTEEEEVTEHSPIENESSAEKEEESTQTPGFTSMLAMVLIAGAAFIMRKK